MRVSLAVVVPEGSDLVGALERAQAEITVVRRAADLAELIAVARSGLVDAVLVAQGADQLGRGVLEEMARAPRPVGVSAMSEVREDRERLRALGVPCLRVDVEPLALAAAVQEAVRAAHTGRTAGMPVDPEDRDPAEVPAESGAPSDAPGPDPDRASGRPPAAPRQPTSPRGRRARGRAG